MDIYIYIRVYNDVYIYVYILYICIHHAALNGDGIGFYDIAGISTASCLLWVSRDSQGFVSGI